VLKKGGGTGASPRGRRTETTEVGTGTGRWLPLITSREWKKAVTGEGACREERAVPAQGLPLVASPEIQYNP